MKDTKAYKVGRSDVISEFYSVNTLSFSALLASPYCYSKCREFERITAVCANVSACYNNDNYSGAIDDSTTERDGRYKNAHDNAVLIKFTDRVTNNTFTSLSSPLICTSKVKRAHKTRMHTKHEAAILSSAAYLLP